MHATSATTGRAATAVTSGAKRRRQAAASGDAGGPAGRIRLRRPHLSDDPAASVWNDTVLVRTGDTVDIHLDVTNPGLWMAHCHIAEPPESGMMFSLNVTP